MHKAAVLHKAVVFDLGRVLVNFDFERGYRALEGLCPYAAAEIPKRIFPTGLVQRFETGLIAPEDFFAQLSGVLELSVSYARFCEIWSSIFAETLVPEPLLERLAERYRLVLLSNTNAIHFDAVRAAYPGVLRHFNRLILSHEVKAMKPKEEIYRAAIAAAQCEAGECFYTDDIAEFVEGGRRMGMDAVRFESAVQIEGELRKRGMLSS